MKPNLPFGVAGAMNGDLKKGWPTDPEAGLFHLDMRMPGRLKAELRTLGVPPSGGPYSGRPFR